MTNLVVKRVINRNAERRLAVDPVHVLVKLRSVRFAIVRVAGDEEQRMNHLVDQRLDQILSRSQLQQRLG